MARITYLIGAGASAQKLPIVKGMAERVLKAIDVLKCRDYLNDLHVILSSDDKRQMELLQINSPNEIIQKIIDLLHWLYEKCSMHPSIDTYAKKLYLKGATRDLDKLKEALIYYFAIDECKFELDYPDDAYESPSTGVGSISLNGFSHKYQPNKGKDVFGLTNNFDSRYELFLASIIDGNHFSLPSNVNILSWNYDYQLERAYVDFLPEDQEKFDLREMSGKLHVRHRSTSRVSLYELEDMPKAFNVFKLNGSAGYIIREKGQPENLYVKPGISILNSNYTPNSLLELIRSYYWINLIKLGHQTVNSLKYENGIAFAWEHERSNDEFMNAIKKVILGTEILVVIGYSFPFFNRNVDKEILLGLSQVKEVYFQDMDPESIEERFFALWPKEDLYGKEIAKPITKGIRGLDQFYIPYQFS